jgi:hypothetical protein
MADHAFSFVPYSVSRAVAHGASVRRDSACAIGESMPSGAAHRQRVRLDLNRPANRGIGGRRREAFSGAVLGASLS